MPELPDVEAFRRYLADHATGQRIERVEAPDPRALRNTNPQGLGRALNGRRLGEPDRHGKWVLTPTDEGHGPTLVLHFGMTGYLTWGAVDGEREDHDRVVFVCEDGELRFNLMRLFGGVWLASDERELEEITGELGPDAADLERDDLAELLDNRRGGLKSALMDQELVAGIGNIVADETLWHAGLHPRQPVPELTGGDIDDLHDALQDVLERSIDHGQVPRDEDWLTHVRADGRGNRADGRGNRADGRGNRADGRGNNGVEDPECPRCGTSIAHGEVNSRSTYWCPRCQPEPD